MMHLQCDLLRSFSTRTTILSILLNHALISTLKSAAKQAFDLNPRAGPISDIYQLITSVTSCNIKLISIFAEEYMRCYKLDVIRVGHSTETMCYSINLMIVTQCDILRCSDDSTNMRKCCVQCSSCCISIHFPWCTFLFFISCLMMQAGHTVWIPLATACQMIRIIQLYTPLPLYT